MKIITIVVIVLGLMILVTLVIEMTNITQTPKTSKLSQNKKCFKLINQRKNGRPHDISDLIDYLDKTPYKHKLIPHRQGFGSISKQPHDVLIIGKLNFSNKVLAMDFLSNDANKYKDIFEYWIIFQHLY